MTYTINYCTTNKIVTLSIVGLVKMSQSMNIIDEMIHLGRENKCNLFVLNGDQVIIQDNFIEVYTLLDKLGLCFQKRRDRLAIVFKNQKRIFCFIDSVAINHGISLKSFDDSGRARRWLNFKPSNNHTL